MQLVFSIPYHPFLYILWIAYVDNYCEGSDFWKFLLGKQISAGLRNNESRTFPNVKAIVTDFGYKFSEHHVTSVSGHILTLHKIESAHSNTSFKGIVMIQHGFLGASDNWLFRGPSIDLPYLLCDSGYEVWMSNMRGNVHSRKHEILNPDDSQEYWMYGLHEMGHQDLAATIDYVLDQSGEKSLFYIGHSVGSTIALILCSTRPEYNAKIRLHLALAPLAYVAHKFNSYHNLVFDTIPHFNKLMMLNNINEIFPRDAYIPKLIDLLCKEGMPTQQFCFLLIFNVVGREHTQFNSTLLPTAATYYPAGSSVYLSVNLHQMFTTGQFKPMDYENEKLNLKYYKKRKPENYNTSLVTSPVSLHYSEGDFLVSEKDIEKLAERLPNVVGRYKVPFKGFNHLDFMWATDSSILLYNKLITLMDQK